LILCTHLQDRSVYRHVFLYKKQCQFPFFTTFDLTYLSYKFDLQFSPPQLSMPCIPFDKAGNRARCARLRQKNLHSDGHRKSRFICTPQLKRYPFFEIGTALAFYISRIKGIQDSSYLLSKQQYGSEMC